MVAALTVIFYAPVIVVSGFESLTSNGYVQALGWSEFEKKLHPGLLVWNGLLLRDWSLSTTLLIVGLALRGCIFTEKKSDQCQQVLSLLFSLAGVAGLIALQRVVPPPRVGLFSIPLLALLAGEGFRSFMWSVNSPKRYLHWSLWFALGVIVPVVLQTQNQSIRNSSETGICPEAEEIVLDLM